MPIFKLVLKITVAIAVVESLIMVAIPHLPQAFLAAAEESLWILPLVDTVVLVVLTSPILYFWAIRPFVLKRNEALQTLSERNERLKRAQEIGRIGFWEFYPLGDRMNLSPEHLNLLGLKAEEFDGTLDAFLQTVLPEYREQVASTYRRIAPQAHAEKTVLAYRVFTRDGGTLWVEDTHYPITEGGSVLGIKNGILQDINERKIADSAKNAFLAIVSHELRSPLTSIQGSINILGSGKLGKLSEQGVNLVNIAGRNCERLTKLVSEILDIEKLKSGKMKFEMDELDLQALLREACEASEGYGDKFGHKFRLNPDCEPVVVMGDRDRLMQVMANLLSNSVKFSGESKQTDIFLQVVGDRTRVCVQDYGDGISDADQGRIFEHFVQADSTDSRKVAGTGLGLPIAKAIIKEHGGTIGVTSQVGEGSSFHFSLPRIECGGKFGALHDDPAEGLRIA